MSPPAGPTWVRPATPSLRPYGAGRTTDDDADSGARPTDPCDTRPATPEESE